MPLHDHFHSPSSDDLPWESFNTLWVAALVRWLNRTLPRDRFRAFAQIHLGPHVEADVAEFERPAPHGNGPGPATALLPASRPAVATIPAVFPDEVSVRVTEARSHLRLVGCIELVSPGNKKEPAERRAFAAKCLGYLQAGVGLVVVDVVAERRANLHVELMQLMCVTDPAALAVADPTYAVGYRPVRRDERNEIDLWPTPVCIGDPLPVVPFALKGGPVLDLELEATYSEAVADSGL